MALLKFRECPEFVALLRDLRPNIPRKINTRLLVAPRAKNTSPSTVGTAFDYLLRFELLRRSPKTEAWLPPIASEVAKLTFSINSIEPTPLPSNPEATLSTQFIECYVGFGSDFVSERSTNGSWGPTCQVSSILEELQQYSSKVQKLSQGFQHRALKMIEESQAFIFAYREKMNHTRLDQEELARHAIRMAQLETIWYTDKMNSEFEDTDPEAVGEILDLLDVVPFDLLADDLLIPPMHIGDLIVGNLLLDIKTTKSSNLQTAHLDQLATSLIFARHEHKTKSLFPVVNQLGLYFSRYGRLWIQEASSWTEHPRFSEVEKRVLAHCSLAP